MTPVSDLVGRFARDPLDDIRLLITRHIPEHNVVHYIHVDKPGGGSQELDRLEIEPHPADEANRLRQEIEDLRDEHWEKYKELDQKATWLERQFGVEESAWRAQQAEDELKAAVRLTQILEGVNG